MFLWCHFYYFIFLEKNIYIKIIMADTRGKDLVKRLNYDELKDKITKTKKPIIAPYRTATIVRNSNQMQNLLQMNNFDMEKHQAQLQKEQIKQAVKGEMINKEKPQSNVPVVSNSTHFFRIADEQSEDLEETVDKLTEIKKEKEEKLNKQNAEDLSETGNLARIGAAAATSVIANPAVAVTSDSSQSRKQQTKKEIIKETKQMSTKNIIQELQDMYDANFLPKELAQAFERVKDEDMPNAYKDKDDEYGKEIVKALRTIRESAKMYENNLEKFKQSKASSKERAKTPPSKVPPGEEFGATPERNIDAITFFNQKKADNMKVGTITVFMNDAYENEQLNEVQTKTWENIVNKSKTLDKNDKKEQSDLGEIIRQEYAVYLSYKKRRPSRGRSVPPKSTASSSGMQPTLTETPYGDTGGEGTKRKPGRPLGSINKPKL
jgi:hypothetical protein